MLGLCLVCSCNSRLLPDGFPSSNAGAGGALATGTVVVLPPGVGGSGAGGSGAGGSDADGGGALGCDELAALYVAAVEQDRACDPNSSGPQCQLHVIPALCGTCAATTYVNSNAASTAARLRWDKVPCPVPVSCSAECRPLPSGSRCVPMSDGSGHCEDIVP